MTAQTPVTQTYQPQYDLDIFENAPNEPGGLAGTTMQAPKKVVNYPYCLSRRNQTDFLMLCQQQFPGYTVAMILGDPYPAGEGMDFTREVPLVQFTSNASGAQSILNAGEFSFAFFGVFGLWTNNGGVSVTNSVEVTGARYNDYAGYVLPKFTEAVQAQLPA